jgi:predicted nucleic acid-binding protein
MPAFFDGGDQGRAAREWLLSEQLFAPEIIDLEVVAAVRRQVIRGEVSAAQGEQAVLNLRDLSLRRVRHRSLIARCWQLRNNVTAYDAAYVALAEALRTNLVTADGRLAHAPGLNCPVDLLT